MIHHLTDDNFDKIINTNKALYILFIAEDLPNADNVVTIFEDLDLQFKGKIDICICDINANKYIAEHYQMQTLPGVLFMRKHKVYANFAGPASAQTYMNVAKESLMQMISDDKKG